MATSFDQEGRSRLLVTAIDQIASSQPQRTWVTVPKDENDLSDGIVDITFKQFSNAINHAAAWLHSKLGPSSGNFDTFAYEGPNYVRVAILTVAAIKVERKIMLPYPSTPVRGKIHLLESVKCAILLYAESSRDSAESILREKPEVLCFRVPSLRQWMTEEVASHYEYKKTWSDAKNDPCIVFHTSGTTGPPKPVIYTNLMMTSLSVSQSLPDADHRTSTSCFIGQRVYSTIPMYHLVGMVAVLQSTVWLRTVLVLSPANKPLTAPTADQMLRFAEVVGFVAPTIIIKALCQQTEMFERLKKLKFVQWAGAPLDEITGNMLCHHVQMSPAFGTTECGPYFTRLCEDPTDWKYYWFRQGQGIDFVPLSSSSYELIFRRGSDARWQQIFLLFPELEEYRTKDTFQRHATKDYLWLYSGRTDDVVMLANGKGLSALDMEIAIMCHSAVQCAIVGGDGRSRPFLILELNPDIVEQMDNKNDMLSKARSAIYSANQLCPDFAKISDDFIIFVRPGKPVLKSMKDSALRRETLVLYSDDINALYSRFDQANPVSG